MGSLGTFVLLGQDHETTGSMPCCHPPSAEGPAHSRSCKNVGQSMNSIHQETVGAQLRARRVLGCESWSSANQPWLSAADEVYAKGPGCRNAGSYGRIKEEEHARLQLGFRWAFRGKQELQ